MVRVFCSGGAVLLFALCFHAQAQQPVKLRHVGFLCPAQCGQPEHDGFRDGLREIGYVEGRDVSITYRAANSNAERLPALAADFVGLKVDAIVTASTPAITAAKEATSSIPIVFASAGDPVAAGLVASLAKPGGNVTGITILSPELAVSDWSCSRRLFAGSHVWPSLSTHRLQPKPHWVNSMMPRAPWVLP